MFLDSLSACKGVQGQVPDFVVGAWLKLYVPHSVEVLGCVNINVHKYLQVI